METMNPRLIFELTPLGLKSIEIHYTSDKEEELGQRLYKRIRPALKIAEALLKEGATNDQPK